MFDSKSKITIDDINPLKQILTKSLFAKSKAQREFFLLQDELRDYHTRRFFNVIPFDIIQALTINLIELSVSKQHILSLLTLSIEQVEKRNKLRPNSSNLFFQYVLNSTIGFKFRIQQVTLYVTTYKKYLK